MMARALTVSTILSCAVAAFLGTPALRAQDTPDVGAIVDEAERRVSGYGDFTARLTMTLRSGAGSERTRVMQISGLEVPEDGDKTLVVFEEPRDLQGTAVLTVTHREAASEQWLHLPAARRTRRIASGSRTDSFLGSEFTYEDMGSLALRRYRYRYLRREALAGRDMHVLERAPLDGDSGYSRHLVWLDTGEYRVFRIDYFDLNGEPTKSLNVDGYERYAGGQWRPTRMVMADLGSGRSTTLDWTDYAFGTGLDDSDFDSRRLGR
jgi:hypothetical protein